MFQFANSTVFRILITALVIVVTSGVALSDDVQLNPSFIAGSARVGTTAETAIGQVDVIARSGQLRSEGMAKHVLVVLSNALEGTDDVFNDWYTNTHLPDVIKVKGFSGAQRFKLSSAQLADDGREPYKYLAIYEVDADDVTVPRDALRESANNPEAVYIDPALDRDRTVAWFYTPITGLVKR
jgi:hypothetical protein